MHAIFSQLLLPRFLVAANNQLTLALAREWEGDQAKRDLGKSWKFGVLLPVREG